MYTPQQTVCAVYFVHVPLPCFLSVKKSVCSCRTDNVLYTSAPGTIRGISTVKHRITALVVPSNRRAQLSRLSATGSKFEDGVPPERQARVSIWGWLPPFEAPGPAPVDAYFIARAGCGSLACARPATSLELVCVYRDCSI